MSSPFCSAITHTLHVCPTLKSAILSLFVHLSFQAHSSICLFGFSPSFWAASKFFELCCKSSNVCSRDWIHPSVHALLHISIVPCERGWGILLDVWRLHFSWLYWLKDYQFLERQGGFSRTSVRLALASWLFLSKLPEVIAHSHRWVSKEPWKIVNRQTNMWFPPKSRNFIYLFVWMHEFWYCLSWSCLHHVV